MKNFVLITIAFISFSKNLFSQNYYSVKFPDDITVFGCGANVPNTLPTITHTGTCSFGVGVAVKDQIFYTNQQKTCGKIFRKFTLNYWCDYNPNWLFPTLVLNPENSDVGATAFGNPQNHGFFEYTQIIKFLDQNAPVFVDCPASPLVFCDFSPNDPTQWNNHHMDLCEGKVDLRVKVTDGCSKSQLNMTYLLWLDLDGNGTQETFIQSSNTGAFPMATSTVADTLVASIQFPQNYELPYGKHKIEWIANDNCGNKTTCKYDFMVQDCAPPTVVCLHGLSANIMQTGMLSIWDTDFLKYAEDNCTPTQQLKFGIRKKGAGTGFPQNQHGVTFSCQELGQQFVEIWAVDAAGNAAFCETYITVQDPFGDCKINNIQHLRGTVALPDGTPLPQQPVQLLRQAPLAPLQLDTRTDSVGKFEFLNADACNAQLSIRKDTLPSVGIDALDLLLLDRFLNGSYSFSTPYQHLAADLNADQKIDFDDLMAIVQHIIQPSGMASAADDWQFLPKNFKFSQPDQPLDTPVPSTEKIDCTQPLSDHSFIAIKKGDLDNSAARHWKKTSNREVEQSAIFSISDKIFEENEVFSVEIKTPSLLAVAAFQFTLAWNKDFLTLEHADSDLLTDQHFFIENDKNRLAAIWASAQIPNGITPKRPRTTAFLLTFRAKRTGKLSETLHFSNEIAESLGFSLQQKVMTAELLFESHATDRHAVFNVAFENQIGSPQPNPVRQGNFTEIPFLLEHEQPVQFAVLDISGRMLANFTQNMLAGEHRQRFDFVGSGTFFIQIRVGNESIVVKKVIVH